MNLLESIVEFFNTYGWPGVCAILIIGGLFYGAKYIDKKADARSTKMSTQLSSNIIDAFTKIEENRIARDRNVEIELIQTINKTISHAITSHYDVDKKNHKDSETHRTNMTSDVSDKLWDMLKTFNAQRATILELHNGGVNLNGLSFIRYDITNEKQAKGVLPINGLVQNLPASNLEVVYKDVLLSDNDVVIYNQEDIDKLYDRGATVLYSDLRDKLNASHMVYAGIYNDENILYALICLEYQNGYPYPENIIDEVEIARYTSEISQLYKYVKKY